MQPKPIFRKVSLDRLSSPEQLDELMHTTSPRGWIALAALWLLLGVGIAWGFVGELPESVVGSGILTRAGGVLEVVNQAPGRVTDLNVRVGDVVRAGQEVAVVEQPTLRAQLDEARQQLAALQNEQAQGLGYRAADAELQRARMGQQRASLQGTIDASREVVASLEERMHAQEQLVEQGLITRSTLLATRQQYDQAREKVRTAQAQQADLEVQRLGHDFELDERQRDAGRRLEQQRAEVARLEREYRRAAEVTSPYAGRVLELIAEPGKMVGTGDPVLTLDRAGRGARELEAVVYVPAQFGKRVRPGMRIQVAPATVRSEEFGMITGRVTSVSAYPATPRGMQRMLKNDQLVTALSGGGAPYEVHATLAIDPKTPSGFRWTSSHGPPLAIQSGTLAGAQVIVDSQRPIARVIPLLRRWSGM
ncbi:MAG TPA: NHLP bacteriocin system secretion protein [Longimicrobium sp.]|nr:NHLP bacteriocin system secretion protein [Longimicrobium sp.]